MRPGRKSGLRSSEHRAVAQAKDYVLAHLSESLTTKQMAARVGVDRSYFSRLFKRTTGMTFRSYVRLVRMGHATTLLRDGRLSVKQVAHEAGFKSVSHFHHLFVAQAGQTPLDYQVTRRQ